MAMFEKTPTTLYTVDGLLFGFDPARPGSYGETPDFQIYLEFVTNGGASSTDKPAVLSRAEHDCSILQLLAQALVGRKVVALMGGHQVARGTRAYADAATVAARLAERGFLIITGGGPGAMEAAHLGAAVGRAGKDLGPALARMPATPAPPGRKPVLYTGAPEAPVKVDQCVIAQLGAYYAPAWEVRQDFPEGGGIAIPTWMYGWEPTTVFAGAVAKYFQNSIREDGLLAAATHGIVYAEGRAGTLQEVFQDAAQNYYLSFPAPAEGGKGVFSPMVFLGDFWTDDPADGSGRTTLPVRHLLDCLWKAGGKDASGLVHYVQTPEAAVAAIEAFQGPDSTEAVRIAAAGAP